MKERPDVELFGPLLQVIRVETFEAAIAEAKREAIEVRAAASAVAKSQASGRYSRGCTMKRDAQAAPRGAARQRPHRPWRWAAPPRSE